MFASPKNTYEKIAPNDTHIRRALSGHDFSHAASTAESAWLQPLRFCYRILRLTIQLNRIPIHRTNRRGAAYWIDQSDQLWIFGGEGFGATSTSGNGLLNDMWRYLPYP